MDPQVAVIVLAGITAIGAIVWLVAARFLMMSARTRHTGQQPVGDEIDPSAATPAGWVTGSAEVEGDPSSLSDRAAASLARGNLGTQVSVKIVEKGDNHLRFERLDASAANQPVGQWFKRGEVRFTPLRAGRTRVEWCVEPLDMRWLLTLGAAFQVLGLLALVGGCALIYTLVATSPNPAVRWQTFQMVQAVHFLWPPFLFAALYRRGKRAVASQFEALASNLPYYGG